MSGPEDARAEMSVPLRIGLVLIAGVWAAGAWWSFEEQRQFARRLKFHVDFLLPAVADGLPVAMGAVAFSAALDGRPAGRARLGTALAVGGSVASNGLNAWGRTHGDLTTVVVACAVPLLAGIAFEVLLAELRTAVLVARGEIVRRPRRAAPEPVPPLRPIRLALDPLREFGQWRRHVLAVTDPAADPVGREVLSRLVDAVSQRPAAGVSAGGPVGEIADEDVDETVFEAPRWPTAPAGTAEENAVIAGSGPWGGRGATDLWQPAAVPPALAAAWVPALDETATAEISTERSAAETAAMASERSRAETSETAAETSRSETTETAGEMSRSSRPVVSRSVARRVSRETSRSETPDETPDEVSAGSSRRGVSQRAAMAAWAASQLDAGVELSGADLDRQFGTRNYGRAVLRQVRADRAAAAETPQPAGELAAAGVGGGSDV